MDFMNMVLRQYLGMFVIVFIDDILIYLRSEDDHINHLRIVLQILREQHFLLKDRLTSDLLLTLPKGRDGFVVYCDVSRIGLGCVLMLNGKVITYDSRQLKFHEKNYPTHDLELTVVIFALKIWRHYLYSVYVDVFTNHKSLQYVFNQKDLNLYQRR
ncbi:hypothetical protein MTR67_034762 [Solanum verrucosum]|uniref:Reverse transcriptase domain-containing protein n=1 Tax=Solanum verrucosum TaxID=315347 RepID=A0AAF0U8N8_SOLVR|nr:hypothetical protein MTR67_034762 [Solanum verrucosum]